MDLGLRAKQTFVVMNLLSRDGTAKLVRAYTYPFSGVSCVSRVYTDLAVFLISPDGWSSAVHGPDFSGLSELVDVPHIDGHRGCSV